MKNDLTETDPKKHGIRLDKDFKITVLNMLKESEKTQTTKRSRK